MRIIVFFICLFSWVCTLAFEDNSINANKNPISNVDGSFSFIIAGHIYGSPTSNSNYPSESFTGFLAELNKINPSFVMLLGDNYKVQDSLSVLNFEKSILQKINSPVFNTIGNHDLADIHSKDRQNYEVYHQHFGSESFYSFMFEHSLFIVLDSELYLTKAKSNGSIMGKQLAFLSNELNKVESGKVKNVFVCVHKEINLWTDNNYLSEVAPLFKSLDSKGVSAYLLSGDMEKFSNDLYMIKDTECGVTYLHTHISDSETDKIIRIDVSENGEVNVVPISLTGNPALDIDSYSEIRSISNFSLRKTVFVAFVVLVLIAILFILRRKAVRSSR